MSDERIDVEIKDSVSGEIAIKINGIATAAKEGYKAVEQLKKQLQSVGAGGISQLKSQLDSLNVAVTKNAIANQRLATVQQQTAGAAAKAQLAQTKVTTSQLQGSIAATKLASSQQLAAQKIAAAHANQAQRIAATQANSAQRLITAQNQSNNAALRGQLVNQRLATAQQQTAAAATRAALAQNKLHNALNKVNGAAQGASSGIGAFIRRFAAMAGIALTADAIVEAADAYTTLQNKMRVVSETEQGLETMTKGVFDIANRTRTGVMDTAAAYVRFDLAMKQLGGSQEDSLRLTETVNKALILSGANTKEAASGLLQLSQAMNKGKLDGDEFRSVMELMPRIADAIAKKMGVARGELLNLAPQGKITAKVLKEALSDAASEIDAQFAKTIPTVGQSLEILKNKFIQTFGQINKSLGLSSGIATAFKFIGNHIKEVLVILGVLSVALIAVFGPTLITMLSTAASAVWAFTVALMANPIGLIAVGISAAIAAIMLYGDELTITADKQVTLKDAAIGTWHLIKQAASDACDYIKSAWNVAIDFLNTKTNGWAEKFRDIAGLILGYLKFQANSMIGLFIGLYNSIIKVFSLLPLALKDIFAITFNLLMDLNYKMLSSILDGISAINSIINATSEKLGIGKILDDDLKLSIAQYRFEVVGAAYDIAIGVHDAFASALTTDYIGNAMKAIEAEARKVAEARRKAEEAGGLRGLGTAAVISDPKAIKEAERRRFEMDKLNRSMDEELTKLRQKQPLDYVQNRMLQITNDMLDKKITLTRTETASIRDKVKAIQAQRSANEVGIITKELEREYEVLQSVREERWRDNKMSEIELRLKEKQMVMTDQERTKLEGLLKVMQAQREANAVKEITRELDQESKLFNVIGPQREVQQQLNQIDNEQRQKGNFLTKDHLKQIGDELKLMQIKKSVDTELQTIYGQTIGAQLQLIYQEAALNKAWQANIITTDQYKQRFGQLAVASANLRLQLNKGSLNDMGLSVVGSYIQNYNNVLDSLKNNFTDFFATMNNGFADSFGRAIVYGDNLGESLMKVGKEAMGALISGLIKLGIQWALNAALGHTISSSFMASQAAMSAAMAATVASAWAPAAAMVSLATMGMNATGAMAGIGAANAMTQGLAALSFTGFKQGGYTGNGDMSAIAGLVHGREFVVNAQATSANRPVLEAMNAGRQVSPNVNITVEHDGSTAIDVVNVSPDEIRIIAKQQAMSVLHSHGPSVIANDLADSNSRTSKAIQRNTNTRRRR
jgi:tape measure domain-containing protein